MKVVRALYLVAAISLPHNLVPAAPLSVATVSVEEDAWALFRKRDYGAALKLFERDAVQNKEWAELQDAMGWCHYYLGNLEQAGERFRKALRIKEDYKWSLMGLDALDQKRTAPLEAAHVLLSSGLYTEAKAAFQRIIEGKTDAGAEARYSAHCGEGWSLFYLGEVRAALHSFRKAHKLNKSGADGLRGIGWCEYAHVDYHRALTALQLSLEVEPRHYYTHIKCGWAHYFLGDYESARGSFQTALSLPDATWEAWAGSGWCSLELKEEDAALEQFARAIRMSPYAKTAQLVKAIEARPKWRSLHNVAGWSALNSSLDAWAMAEFEYSERLGYEPAESIMGQAFALFRMERYDETLAHIEQASSVEGTDGAHTFHVTSSSGELIEVAMNLVSIQAWIAYRQGRYDEAVGLFRKVGRSHPNWVDARCGEGWALYAQGNYPAAEKAFERALQISPAYSDALSGQQAISAWRYYDYNRGWSLLLSGDLLGARLVFQSIQEDSRKPFPKDRMELIEASLGWVASWLGERELAIEHFGAALHLRPKLGLAERGWGELLFAEQDWTGAAIHLQSAVATKELAGSGETWVTLGLSHLRSLQLQAAEKAFARAIALAPTLAVAHQGQALLHLQRGEVVDARIALERAFSLDPFLADGAEIRDMLNGTPGLHRLHSVLGWSWYYRSNYEKALVEFEWSLKRDPLETSAQQGKGFALLKLKRTDEGRKALEIYLAEMPKHEDPWGPWSTTLSTLGWALYADEQYSRAITVFRRLAALHKGQKLTYADPHDGLGWCYLRKGSEGLARLAFKEALAIAPAHASSLRGLQALE